MSAYLEQIEISNFKSFDGLCKIGPLKPESFTAIIGPNGSGKSNFIDAIAFCIGEKSRKLRVVRNEELVNRSQKCDTCDVYVALKFQLENGYERTYKRSIIHNSSEYRINQKIISKEEYQKKLCELSINISSGNCIIYQDDIDSIMFSSPKERMMIFEKMSHSIDFKEQYDYLKGKLDELHIQTHQAHEEKKMLVAYRKKLIHARCDNHKQLELQNEYDETMTELTLLHLYVNECHTEKFKVDCASMNVEIGKINEEIKSIVERIQMKKEKLSGYVTCATSTKDKINNGQEKYRDDASKYYDNKEKIRQFEKRLKQSQKLLGALTKHEEARERAILHLEEDLQQVSEAKLKFVQNSSQEFVKKKDKMAEWDRKYDQLKAIVVKDAAKFYRQLHSLEREKQPFLDKIENGKRKHCEIVQNIERKTRLREDIQKRIESMQKNIKETTEKIQIQDNVFTELTQSINSSEEKQKILANELKIITEKLIDSEISEVEAKKILEENFIIQSLHQFFSGVHDRIYKLVRPIHSRYKIAFTKIFSPYFSNIIVDDTSTAIKCIKHLKQYQIGRCAFLPLDGSLRVEQLKDSLRSFKQLEGIKNVKLLYDLITFPSNMTPAILHIVNNILVCEDDETAMHVAYNLPSGRKYDCISLSGTYYRKNGIFSGGEVSLKERSKILNVAAREELEIKRDEICSSLKKLHNSMDKADLEISKSENEQLKKKLKYCDVDLKKIQKESEDLNVELKKLDGDLQEVTDVLSRFQAILDALDEKINDVQIEINQIEDRVFADFCVEVDIVNIRKYEKPIRLFRDMKLKELEYDDQCERIRNLLSYEKERSKRHEIEKLQKDLDKVDQEIKAQYSLEVILKGDFDKQKDYLDQCQETLAITTCEITKLKEEIAKDEEDLKEATNRRLALDENSFAVKIMENLRERHNLLVEAKMHDISLPLIDGTLLYIPVDSNTLRDDVSHHRELLEMYEDEEKYKFDYNNLKKKPKSPNNPIEVSKIENDYKEKLENLIKCICDLNPTAKVSQELEVATEKLQQLNRRLTTIVKLNKEIRSKFEKVKNDRYKAFMDFFESTAENVDNIYKEINADNSAQAVLIVENPEEPYLSGVHYNAIPPKKRRGGENLSGGEVALATLSLIFAAQRKCLSPFLLFDEIDGALDQNNRRKIVEYMNKMKNHQQIIAISLHKELFSKCETLIGVFQSKSVSSQPESSLVVLDLSAYK